MQALGDRRRAGTRFRQGVEPNAQPPYYWIMIKIRAVMARIFSYSGRCTEISLKFYGQKVVFDHFVRNRHFSGRPFTDKLPIFIDLSVNGSDFDKCSVAHHLLNYCTWPQLRAKRWFLRFARNLSPHCFGEGNRVEHFSDFWRFCSTFEAVRAEFGVGGRTFFQFWMILFYFLSRADRIWSQR